jgi:hypothetical protein
VTLVQAIFTAEDHVVASIVDLGVICLSWFDVDVLERPVEAWALFGAVHPCDSVLSGGSGKVGKVDVGPPAVS